MVDLKENYLQIPRGGRVRNDTDAGLLIPKRKRNRKLHQFDIGKTNSDELKLKK